MSSKNYWRWTFVLLVIAVISYGICPTRSSGADPAPETQPELTAEETYSREALDMFLDRPVEVYLDHDALAQRKPTINAKAGMKAVSHAGRTLYRFRTNEGDIWLVAPEAIVAVKIPGVYNH